MYDNYNPLEVDQSREISPLYLHVAKTYLWMFIGLLVTFATAYTFYVTDAWFIMIRYWGLHYVLLVAKLGLVMYLSSSLHKFSLGTAKAIFIGYSVLTGIVFSTLFVIYAFPSMVMLFLATAVFFGAMAAVGLVMKRDVSHFASTILFGLVALIAMHIIGWVFRMEFIEIMACFFGIILFLGITIYDNKKTKDFYHYYQNDAAMLDKVCIYSALQLYLDFINIFLYLLRLFAKRK